MRSKPFLGMKGSFRMEGLIDHTHTPGHAREGLHEAARYIKECLIFSRGNREPGRPSVRCLMLLDTGGICLSL